jgi:predicted ribosome quality control (RQC) complex YloA/Tae2 family protein
MKLSNKNEKRLEKENLFQRVEIDLNKTIEANASSYYVKVKKLKKKLDGAKDALMDSHDKIKKIEQDKEKIINEIEKEKNKEQIKKEWYEKFRWFISSEGFLVIGGRDATSNEIVIKKHTEKGDLIFHTDMIGSPFFVIKSEKKKPGKATIQEAADATITFSRAFKLGITTTPTFQARPDQLTKVPKSGEYVPKGGFITEGGLTYVDNKINLSLGNYKGHIMAGPIEAIKKHCKDYIELQSGKEKPGKIAKTIQHKIQGELDDIIRSLPGGTFKVKK